MQLVLAVWPGRRKPVIYSRTFFRVRCAPEQHKVIADWFCLTAAAYLPCAKDRRFSLINFTSFKPLGGHLLEIIYYDMAKWGQGDPRWIVEERPDATNVNNWHW